MCCSAVVITVLSHLVRHRSNKMADVCSSDKRSDGVEHIGNWFKLLSPHIHILLVISYGFLQGNPKPSTPAI